MPRLVSFPPPSIHVCPDCEGPVTAGRCQACGLGLDGPDAGTLWWIDTELHRLGSQRIAVLTKLRRAGPRREFSSGQRPAMAGRFPGPALDWAPGVAPVHRPTPWPAPPATRPARRPVRVQHILLGLGAFCLVVAAVVFAAVTWSRLGAVAKGGILLGATAVLASAASACLRRNLAATAEALGVVAVGLALVDIHALRVGMFPDVEPAPVWAAGLAVVATACWLWARIVPLGVARLAALAAAQLPLPILAVHASRSAEVLAAVLLGQAGALVALLRTVDRREAPAWFVTVAASVAATQWVAASVVAAVMAAFVEADAVAAPAALLFGAGGLAAMVAWCWADRNDLRLLASGAATFLVLAATTTAARGLVQGDALPLAAGAISVTVLALALQASPRWRSAPSAVATLAAAGSVLPALDGLGTAVLTPLSQLSDPWHHALSDPVRALPVDLVWTSWALAAGALAVAWAVVGLWARRLDRTVTMIAGTMLAGVSVALLPLAVDASALLAMSLALTVTVLAAGFALIRPGSPEKPAGYCLALWAGITAAGWGSVTPNGSITVGAVLGALALAMVAAAVRRGDAPLAVVAGSVALVSGSVLAVIVPLAAGASADTGWLTLGFGAVAISVLAPVLEWATRRLGEKRSRQVLESLSATIDGHALLAAVASTVALGSIGAADHLGLVAVAVTIALAAHALRPRRTLALLGAAVAGLLVSAPTVSAGDSLLVLGCVVGSAAAVVAIAVRRRDAFVAGGAVVIAAPVGAALVVGSALALDVSDATAACSLTVAAAALSALAWAFERWGARSAGDPAAGPVAHNVAAAVDVTTVAWCTIGAVALAAMGEVDLLSLSMLLGVAALALHALRPSRRQAVYFAAVLAVALVWLRLGVADVHLVEAYSLPAATALLVGGWFNRQRASSWVTAAPGLIVAFGPSLAVMFTDPGLARPLGLATAAAATVLIASRWRLQAPLAIGAGALVVVGTNQFGPAVAALPRYLVFAVLGCLLLAVGATFEQRRRDVANYRDRFAALR